MFMLGQRVHTLDMTHDPEDVYTITGIRRWEPNSKEMYRISCENDCLMLESDLKLADMGSMSDGYHTFDELYEHRMILTATVCRMLQRLNYHNPNKYRLAIRSIKHHPEDSPMFDGCFVVVMNLPDIGQISYHYKLKHWSMFNSCITAEYAPKYDGHTPESTITRLVQFINSI